MIVWRSQTLDVLRLGIFAKISTQMKTRLLPFALVTVVDAEKWKSIKKKMRACYGTKPLGQHSIILFQCLQFWRLRIRYKTFSHLRIGYPKCWHLTF